MKVTKDMIIADVLRMDPTTAQYFLQMGMHCLGCAIAHGETIAEPVEPGTNRAAIEAGVTILAHPGLITEEEARLAAQNGVYLEITSKKGHSLTNGHVYKVAKKVGAEMVLDSDSHSDSDFLSPEYAKAVLAGCGMDEQDIQNVLSNNCKLLEKLTGK